VARALEVEQHLPPPAPQRTIADALDVEEHGRALAEAAVAQQGDDVLVPQDGRSERGVRPPAGGAGRRHLRAVGGEVGRGRVEVMGGEYGHETS
jgi:hypothetical protein